MHAHQSDRSEPFSHAIISLAGERETGDRRGVIAFNACAGNMTQCIAILCANRYCMSEVLFNKAKAEAPKTLADFAGIFLVALR